MTDWSGRQSALRHHKHFQNDIIDPVTSDPASLGGAQTIRLLGPFVVNFDTPGIPTVAPDYLPLILAALPAGGVVIKMWAQATVVWDQLLDSLAVDMCSADGSEIATLSSYSAFGNVTRSEPSSASPSKSAFIGAYKKLAVEVYLDGQLPPPASGSAGIYALILDPA